jgi:hypothetical protein
MQTITTIGLDIAKSVGATGAFLGSDSARQTGFQQSMPSLFPTVQ